MALDTFFEKKVAMNLAYYWENNLTIQKVLTNFIASTLSWQKQSWLNVISLALQRFFLLRCFLYFSSLEDSSKDIRQLLNLSSDHFSNRFYMTAFWVAHLVKENSLCLDASFALFGRSERLPLTTSNKHYNMVASRQIQTLYQRRIDRRQGKEFSALAHVIGTTMLPFLCKKLRLGCKKWLKTWAESQKLLPVEKKTASINWESNCSGNNRVLVRNREYSFHQNLPNKPVDCLEKLLQTLLVNTVI